MKDGRKKNESTPPHTLMVHPDLGKGGKHDFSSMWLEIPGACPLGCVYCFASAQNEDNNPDNLTRDEYKDLIRQFVELGGNKIGIPGKGEPFYKDNKELVFFLLDEIKKYDGVHTVIFTAGFFPEEEARELARRLKNYDVTVLFKCNSRNPKVQDRLVRRDGYTVVREKALNVFMEQHFQNGPGTKLGIVTSLMEANYKELPELLSFARKSGLIFDCDTLLHQGRGETCEEDPSPTIKRQAMKQLQRQDVEQGYPPWHITPTYVGTCCDRFCCHLYVTVEGLVRPCVGSPKVTLGNIRKQSLAAIWKSSHTNIFREHFYFGTCSYCLNFLLGRCHSCLGRSTYDLENANTRGYVSTRGCWNLSDDPIHLLSHCANLLRSPSKYLVHSDKDREWTKALRTGHLREIWGGYFGVDLSVKDFLTRRLPMPRTVPLERHESVEASTHRRAVRYGELLGHVMLYPLLRLFASEELWWPPESWQFERPEMEEREDTQVLLTIAMFYDEVDKDRYFVRTLTHPGMSITDQHRIRLLTRWFDMDEHLQNTAETYHALVYDFSEEIRKSRIDEHLGADYEYALYLDEPVHKLQESITKTLSLGKESGQAAEDILPLRSLNCKVVLDHPEIRRRAAQLIALTNAFVTGNPELMAQIAHYDLVSELHKLPKDYQAVLTDCYAKLPACFFPVDDSPLAEALSDALVNCCKDLKLDIGNSRTQRRLANYFIWLSSLNDKLHSYEVFFAPTRMYGTKPVAGLVVATNNKLSNRSVFFVRSILSQALAPLTEEYLHMREEELRASLDAIREAKGKEERALVALGNLAHNFNYIRIGNDNFGFAKEYLVAQHVLLKNMVFGETSAIEAVNLHKTISDMVEKKLLLGRLQLKNAAAAAIIWEKLFDLKGLKKNITVRTYPGLVELVVENLIMNSLKSPFDKNWVTNFDQLKIFISSGKVTEAGKDYGCLTYSDSGAEHAPHPQAEEVLKTIREFMNTIQRKPSGELNSKGFGVYSISQSVKFGGGKVEAGLNAKGCLEYKVFLPAV